MCSSDLTVFLCCVAFLCIAYFSGIRVNLSGSLPHRLYRIAALPEGKALSRGELVMPDTTDIPEILNKRDNIIPRKNPKEAARRYKANKK